jgi:hypothetical protein
MTKMKKPTKRDNYNALLGIPAVSGNPALVDFINHEIELLDKKNASEKKPTAQQTANDGIKTAILDNMVSGTKYTITDIIKTVPECAELTNQRVSALVRQLISDGLVTRVEEKRKAYFILVD